jgi:hypothetical protein
MTRVTLPREEAERRNRECKKRYYETHKEELREKARAARVADPEYSQKRRASYRKRMDRLIEAGLFQPEKRGRKPIYQTPEEAKEAKREQMKISRARRAERLIAAMRVLNERLAQQPLPKEDPEETSSDASS